ncbi:hypothetical protein IFM89_029236, partial [Coptis chinensis]
MVGSFVSEPQNSSFSKIISNMDYIKSQQNTTTEHDDFMFAMNLVCTTSLPMVIKLAVELNLFEIIAKAGPGAQLSPKDITSHLPTQNPNTAGFLDRILRLLASYNVLTSTLATHEDDIVERLYGLAPVSKYFVPNEEGVSLASYVLLSQDKACMDSWYHLKDSILEGGIPFNKVHGKHMYEYAGVDPRFNEVFNKAMFDHTSIFMKKMLESYKGFKDLKEVVDVGGGLGSIVSMITSKYPTIKGINFDLPHVIAQAPSYPGVEHVGGNMFESVPTSETIFLKWILIDWSDEKCIKLLKNCYKAVPDHGKVIVVDAIQPIAAETSIAAKNLCLIDVGLMLLNPISKERTEEEFANLAKAAGFAGMEKVCYVHNYWIM